MSITPGNDDLDRAQWSRFAAGGGDRCIICGNKAVVSVTLGATELPGKDTGKTGKHLSRDRLVYCNDHGILKYGNALKALRA